MYIYISLGPSQSPWAFFKHNISESRPASVIRCKGERKTPWLRRLVAGFPPRRPGFNSRSEHVGFVVDNVAPGQVFSEYFGFPCQFSFHPLLHIPHHLSSGAGTIGQTVADVPSGLSLTPPQLKKSKREKNSIFRWARIKNLCSPVIEISFL
jgi:hypothetical protein